RSYGGVTSTCELQRTVRLILNVIDTPGLYDFSGDTEFIGKEMAKCIDLAKDVIHAVLVVSRFTREEEAAVQRLQNFFGSKISDYMLDCRVKLKETIEMLQQQLAEEKAARQEALAKAEAAGLEASEKVVAAQRASSEAQMQSKNEQQILRENLEKSERETEKLRNRPLCNNINYC
ncbi:hypothetical protein RD792_011103, partial [Penstemon davidsonii]